MYIESSFSKHFICTTLYESLNVKQNVKPIHKNPQPPLKDLVEADKDNTDTDQNQAVTQDVNANNS